MAWVGRVAGERGGKDLSCSRAPRPPQCDLHRLGMGVA